MDIDKRFEEAKNRIIGTQRERLGIGTLGEKTVHATLKHYYEPNEDYHEVPVEGYVADIYKDGNIVEIQTAQFHRMREKLKAFLPKYKVTVVYPIVGKRQLYWIDPQSGEITPGRSTKKINPYRIFPELYRIKSFLQEENLNIRVVVLDVDEYKFLDGWGEKKKNHASKYDRVPNRIVGEYVIERREDYMQFMPVEPEITFTAKEFAKIVKCTGEEAGIAMNILHEMGMVDRIGKQGNAFVYQVKEIM